MADLKQQNGKLTALWILLGIPVLFIIGGFMHFVYDLSGKSVIVAIIAPVNESVWEHLKMAYWPLLAWWFAGYFILHESSSISAGRWILSCAVAELTCMLVIVAFYYTYTGAFGISSVILDIFSLLLGLTCGQCLALHIYNRAMLKSRVWVYASIGLLLLTAAAFAIFTFYPPHIPLFKDFSTGEYGI